MISVVKHWLVQGADGFRMDAVNHMFEDVNLTDEGYKDNNGDKTNYENIIHDKTMNLVSESNILSFNVVSLVNSLQPESYQFIYDIRAMMDEYKSVDNITRLLMTEAYAEVPDQVRWYGSNATVQGAHMPFNFQLITELHKDSNAADFHTAVNRWLNAKPTWGTVANWVLGNHDRPRVGYRYGEARHESLAIMTMMLPGINVVYYVRKFSFLSNLNFNILSYLG